MEYDYHTADPYLYEILKNNARENRKNPTFEENYVWNFLRNKQLGVSFRRQHVIGEFIVDFVCLSKKIIIEIDGKYHQQEEQMEYDIMRTERLSKYGFRVIRFSNEEILTNIERVLDIIKEEIIK